MQLEAKENSRDSDDAESDGQTNDSVEQELLSIG